MGGHELFMTVLAYSTLHVWDGYSVRNGCAVSHGYWWHLVPSRREGILAVRWRKSHAHGRLLETSFGRETNGGEF